MSEHTAAETGTTWRSVLRFLCLGYAGVLVAITAIGLAAGMSPPPPFIIAAVLFGAAGAWLSRSAGKGPVIFALVISVLQIPTMFWLVFGIVQYTSPLEFFLSAAFLVLALPTLPVSIAALRRGSAPGGARTRTVLTGLAGVALIVAVIGAFVAPDDDQAEGDVVVTAEDFEFVPEKLSVDAGSVTFFLENKDLVAHDISVREDEDADALDGAEIAPGRKGARATYDLAAGTYQFFCSLHAEMDGVLTVT